MLFNCLLYHPLRHPHMLEAFSDLAPELQPTLIPNAEMPYSQTIYINFNGQAQKFELMDEPAHARPA